MKRKSRRLKVNKRIKTRKPHSKKKILKNKDIADSLKYELKNRPMLKNMGTDLVIGHNDIEYDGTIRMGLECIICFGRKQDNPAMSMWDLKSERFTQWDLEKHLLEKHTIEELIKALVKTHWDRLTWGRK